MASVFSLAKSWKASLNFDPLTGEKPVPSNQIAFYANSHYCDPKSRRLNQAVIAVKKELRICGLINGGAKANCWRRNGA